MTDTLGSGTLAQALKVFQERSENAYKQYKELKRQHERDPNALRPRFVKEPLKECTKTCHRVGKEGADSLSSNQKELMRDIDKYITALVAFEAESAVPADERKRLMSQHQAMSVVSLALGKAVTAYVSTPSPAAAVTFQLAQELDKFGALLLKVANDEVIPPMPKPAVEPAAATPKPVAGFDVSASDDGPAPARPAAAAAAKPAARGGSFAMSSDDGGSAPAKPASAAVAAAAPVSAGQFAMSDDGDTAPAAAAPKAGGGFQLSDEGSPAPKGTAAAAAAFDLTGDSDDGPKPKPAGAAPPVAASAFMLSDGDDAAPPPRKPAAATAAAGGGGGKQQRPAGFDLSSESDGGPPPRTASAAAAAFALSQSGGDSPPPKAPAAAPAAAAASTPTPPPAAAAALALSDDEDADRYRGLVAAASGCVATGIEAGGAMPLAGAFTIRAGDSDGYPMKHGGDTFVCKFTGPAYVTAVVSDAGDASYEVRYTGMLPGRYEVDVRFGSSYGDPIAGMPVTVTLGDAPQAAAPAAAAAAGGAASASGAAADADDDEDSDGGGGGGDSGAGGSGSEGSPRASAAASASAAAPRGSARRRSGSDDAAAVMSMLELPPETEVALDLYERKLMLNSLLRTRHTAQTLVSQADDVAAISTGVLAQLDELERKQADLLAEWKRAELKRSKACADIQELVAKCTAAGVEVNAAFYEAPEDFQTIVARIQSKAFGDRRGKAVSLVGFSMDERLSLRQALLAELAELKAGCAALESVAGEVLEGKLGYVAVSEDALAAGGGGGAAGGTRSNTPLGSARSGDGKRGGRGGLQTAAGEDEHAYDVARSEIRAMKEAARKAAMRHKLMQARVQQLEDARFEPAERGLTAKGPKYGGSGQGRKRVAPPAAAVTDDSKLSKHLNELALKHDVLMQRFVEIQEENALLKKKLRDSKKLADESLAAAQRDANARFTELKREHERVLEIKAKELARIVDDSRQEALKKEAEMKHRMQRELRRLEVENTFKAAAIREELSDLKTLLGADTTQRPPRGGASPERVASKRAAAAGGPK